MAKLVTMKTLLQWQQANCAITPLCEHILISYFLHMFLATIHITGVPGCYESTVTMAKKDCSITQQYGSILSSYLMHMLFGTKHITGLPCMFLTYFNFTFLLWKHSHTSKSNVNL